MNTDKKIAVISGGGGYLGSAISQELIRNGFFVIAIEREDKGILDTENIRFKIADISDVSAVKKIAEEVKAEFGEICTIIHTASAPLVRQPVLSLSEDDFTQQFSVNVEGGFHLFKYFSEMLEKNGSIIGITSSAILQGTPHSKSGSYVSAKYGLQGLLRSISSESFFRVYSVAPAFMSGGLNNDLPEIARDFILQKSDPKDIASVENVASSVLSLVNDQEKKWRGKTIALPGFFVTEI
ncbi:MAG: SDR family oxidoreductase [Candidatus Parcubacteria bacterium]|nr:SDR family oxidoreductase [Candidatus Parcubacteria bacterium]